MKIYIQYIYCQLFVFKIADTRLDVLHINLMKVKKNKWVYKNTYLKIPMNAYCLKLKWSLPQKNQANVTFF